MKNIYEVLEKKYDTEDYLTQNMMSRAISDLGITDPSLLDVIYETVIHHTGDWPEYEGWGSSDTRYTVKAVKEAVDSEIKHREAA